MDQLWGIALRARDTDVSLSAIQYLNNYYINCKSSLVLPGLDTVKSYWYHIVQYQHFSFPKGTLNDTNQCKVITFIKDCPRSYT